MSKFKVGDKVIANSRVYPSRHVGRIFTIETIHEDDDDISEDRFSYGVIEEGGYMYYQYELEPFEQIDTKLGQLW